MRSKTQASERRRRKVITFIWIALLSLLVIALIYWEQTALLYILATLGVTALLIVVAVADLGGQTITEQRSDGAEATGEGKIKSTFGGITSSSN
jgi:peptidoglycan/LPS O-acetylase OafA/YrhL